MGKIIDHTNSKYIKKTKQNKRYNGAYIYSKEIVKYIIPYVNTDRNWVTLNIKGECLDHSIVFIHNNLHPENYNWLSQYKDLVLVCGVPETVKKVEHLGKAIYVPLSVNVENIKKYKCEKTKEIAYVGRKAKRKMEGINLPSNIDFIEGLPPTRFLSEMAKYKKVYAVGRCAIEAKILNCEVLTYDKRFPDTEFWKIIDNKDAAKILNKKLIEIDGDKNER